MSKVAHITALHSPSDVRIFWKECISIAEAGIDVVLLAPSDAPSPEYRKNRVELRALPKENGRFMRLLFVHPLILKLALEVDADIYHFHDPELFTVALCLKFLGKTVIYDVHEDLPRDLSMKLRLPETLRRFAVPPLDRAETSLGGCMDGIVAATPTIAERFTEKCTTTVKNFPRATAEWRSVANRTAYGERAPIVTYVGNITEPRGIRQMLSAVGHVAEARRIEFELVGRFDNAETRRSAQRMEGWQYTRPTGWVSRNEVRHLLSKSRVGLAVLQPVPGYVDSLPIKVFEYMLAGLPVIVSDFPILSAIINDADCGLVVDPCDSKQIGEAIQWILENETKAEHMGARGREAVLKKYNWSNEKDNLLDLYKKLLEGNSA